MQSLNSIELFESRSQINSQVNVDLQRRDLFAQINCHCERQNASESSIQAMRCKHLLCKHTCYANTPAMQTHLLCKHLLCKHLLCKHLLCLSASEPLP